MSDEPAEGTVDWEPLLPFVVVTSKDGPYDDQAYAAGWEAAQIWNTVFSLQHVRGTALLNQCVRTANLPQIDLIAMQFGWKMKSQLSEASDEWSLVVFTR